MKYKRQFQLTIISFLMIGILLLGCAIPAQEQVHQEEPAREHANQGNLVQEQVNQKMPTYKGFVNDYANLLSTTSKSMLEDRLVQLEKDTTAEVAVVTLNTIEGQNIDTYATKLFNNWGLGKKDKNNGVLFLIALDDRKTRIEVGYGLESVITNELARKILDEKVLPQFTTQNYENGIFSGIQAIEELIRQVD